MQRVSVFFDTNILIYAHDELSPFHEKSALLLDLAISGEIKQTSFFSSFNAFLHLKHNKLQKTLREIFLR